MPTMTLAVPEDLYALIKKNNQIKWSEIARRAMWDYAKKLELLDKLTADSELTEEDVMELDRVIKRALARHYREEKGS
ncbi:MAG: hypothetical protein KAU14_00235 [Thermoplasmata archaeon]|nr:hypothetical protein [Thermoplasmata archaeon]